MIIDCTCIHCLQTAFGDFCITDDTNNGSSIKHIDQENNQEVKFTTRNLDAERRRRKILSDRLRELRLLVPMITNMNKGAIPIVSDAITYIEELKKSVEELCDQLLQMERTSVDEKKIKLKEIDDEKEMKKWGITPEVQVNHISETKLWIKASFQKKRGGLTKLMEAISSLGFDLNDTSITSSRGTVLFTSSGEGIHGGGGLPVPDTEHIKKLLLEIVTSI